MTTPIIFHVHGHPRPQPRARFVPGRRRPVSTMDPKARLWRSAVEAAVVRVKSDFASSGLPGWLGGPVSLTLTFMFPSADKKRWNQPHTNRRDLDNLAKGPMDVMEKVGLLAKGDARVVHLDARKIWAKVGGMIAIVKPFEEWHGVGVTWMEDSGTWLTTAF